MKDYEKKYKEALERAKKYKLKEDLIITQDIFPELKESEDERIRKEIIATIHLYYGEPLENEAKEMIAWLEKQAQKPAEISNICEFSIKTWIKIVDYVLTEHNGIGNYLIDPEVKDIAEKLQKKYKFDATSEEWDRVYRKGLDAGVNKGRAEALREQNPAWSEEDELYIRELESLVKQEWEKAERENDKDKIHKMSDLSFFLKTLKPQSKQEWSEEDKNRINRLIAYFEDKESFTAEDDIVYANWLKSLRPQSHWKPSENQLTALGAFCYKFKYSEALKSLYDDLKKLKG